MKASDYSDIVLDHYYHPRLVGKLDQSDPRVIIGQAGSSESGEILKIYLRIENNVITDARFQALGGCATIAVGSWLVTTILNQKIDDLVSLNAQKISQELSLPVVKKQAALLAEDALYQAIKR